VGMYGDFTFVNNVLFNWVHRTVDGGDQRSEFNIINNYFKPGPATPRNEPIAYRLLKPESERNRNVVDHFGKAYVSGNIVEGNAKVTADNWDGGVQPDVKSKPLAVALAEIRTNAPFAHAPLPIQPADKVLETVLDDAGATLPKRDAVDRRIVQMVRTGKASAKPGPDTHEQLSHAGYTEATIADLMRLIPLGIITDISQVGGYPEYQGEPIKDLGADGIPLSWKKKYHLDANDAGLAQKDLEGDGYTVMDKYLAGLDPTKKIDWSNPQSNVNTLR
jgi:hypothetical protein